MDDTFTMDDLRREVAALKPRVAVVLPYGTPGAVVDGVRAGLGPLVQVVESPLRDAPPVGSCYLLDLDPIINPQLDVDVVDYLP